LIGEGADWNRPAIAVQTDGSIKVEHQDHAEITK